MASALIQTLAVPNRSQIYARPSVDRPPNHFPAGKHSEMRNIACRTRNRMSSPPCARTRPWFTLQHMRASVSVRLSAMMFLNYFLWGAWYVTIGTWLTATLKFSGTQTGAIFGTTALASMISPFFVGLIADRYFASERVLSALHLIGAVLLYFIAHATSFTAVYSLMLAYCLCFFPTLPLTNSITLRHITNAGDQFPLIRVFATIGWIAMALIIGNLAVEKSSRQFLIAAACSVVMSLFCLTLPHTPPAGRKSTMTWRNILGLDALVMLRDPSYLVFLPDTSRPQSRIPRPRRRS